MNVPRNVLWFEVMLYLSLTLDAVSVAFQDRTPTAGMTAQMDCFASLAMTVLDHSLGKSSPISR